MRHKNFKGSDVSELSVYISFVLEMLRCGEDTNLVFMSALLLCCEIYIVRNSSRWIFAFFNPF